MPTVSKTTVIRNRTTLDIGPDGVAKTAQKTPVPTNLAVHRLRQKRPYFVTERRVKRGVRAMLLRAEFLCAARSGRRLLPWRAVPKKTRTPAPPRPVQAPQRR